MLDVALPLPCAVAVKSLHPLGARPPATHVALINLYLAACCLADSQSGVTTQLASRTLSHRDALFVSLYRCLLQCGAATTPARYKRPADGRAAFSPHRPHLACFVSAMLLERTNKAPKRAARSVATISASQKKRNVAREWPTTVKPAIPH